MKFFDALGSGPQAEAPAISEMLERVVRGHLGTPEVPTDPHGWRCYDKERYPGDCGCVTDLVEDILAVLGNAPQEPCS